MAHPINDKINIQRVNNSFEKKWNLLKSIITNFNINDFKFKKGKKIIAEETINCVKTLIELVGKEVDDDK